MSLVKDTRAMAETFEQLGRIKPTPALRDRILSESRSENIASFKVNSRAVVSMCRKIGAAAACALFLFGSLVALNLRVMSNKNIVSTAKSSAISKNSPEYYPFSLLEESDRTFLTGDVSSAFDKLYALPE